MAVQGKVTQLYADAEKTQAVFPKTNTKCVYDDEGRSVETRLGLTEYYKATLLLDGWQNSDGVYTQTVNCDGVTAAMNGCIDQPKTEHSKDTDVDAALLNGLKALCATGYGITALEGKITWATRKKPEIDMPIYLSCMGLKREEA